MCVVSTGKLEISEGVRKRAVVSSRAVRGSGS